MPPTTGTTTCNLNLRKGAATTFPIITTLKPGTPLNIIEESGDWLKVSASGQVGFVSRKLVFLPTHRIMEGFLIHLPEALTWPLTSARQLKAPAGSGATAKTVVAIWNKFGGLLEPLAAKIHIDPAAALAVVATESGGSGFKNGRLTIRFENHYFWNLWGKRNPDVYHSFFTFNQDKPWTGQQFRPEADQPWQDYHGNQTAEWTVLTKAISLHEDAAKSSISMGLPQIMGANHAAIGYESAGDMFAAFSNDERTQLIGLFDFIQGPHSVSPSVTALQNLDFTAFAARYNGNGQAAAYGATLQQYYDIFGNLRA